MLVQSKKNFIRISLHLLFLLFFIGSVLDEDDSALKESTNPLYTPLYQRIYTDQVSIYNNLLDFVVY